jgi:hypothetical protein
VLCGDYPPSLIYALNFSVELLVDGSTFGFRFTCFRMAVSSRYAVKLQNGKVNRKSYIKQEQTSYISVLKTLTGGHYLSRQIPERA